MKDTHIFFIFVVAVLIASCALMVYYKAEKFSPKPTYEATATLSYNPHS